MKYCKTQNGLANILIDRIDRYWNLEIEESVLISDINNITITNTDLLYKDGKYTAIISHRLGKKRLMLLEKIVNEKKKDNDEKIISVFIE